MGRAPCCDKANVKRGPWSPEEDATLKSYVESHGTGGNWIALPTKAGLRRCGKSCRLRWLNYLRPDIKHGGFTEEEDNVICSLYIQMGSRWSVIASQLPGRTDNDVKNYWNTKLKKKLFSGKISLTTNSTQSSFTNSNHAITLQADSTIPSVNLPCFPKAETHIVDSAFSNSQTQSSSALYLTNAKPALSLYDQRVNFDPYDQLYKPMFMDFKSKFGTSTTTSNNSPNIVSSSTQEGSSISDSCNSVPAMGDKYCHDQSLLPGNFYDDEAGILMDFGFVGLPYYDNIVNGGDVPFEEKASEVDYSFVGIRPEGVLLNQSVNNDY